VTFAYSGDIIKGAISEYVLNPRYPIETTPNILAGYVAIINNGYKHLNMGESGGDTVPAIWNRSRRCRTPIVEKIPGTQRYLARCSQDDFWHILCDRPPGSGGASYNPYDAVMAECTHTSISFGPHKGEELENCVRRILFDDFRVDYDFQAINAAALPKLDAFIEARVRSWRSNCRR
jgi:hypothetical protein